MTIQPPTITRFSILLGGSIKPTGRLLAQVARSRAIAADSGMQHASPLGLAPELWVGDFDSAPASLLAAYPDTPRQVHPADKDMTDGEIAVATALQRGARELVLAGGLGGQTDHALGHLALLLKLSADGIAAFATSGVEEAYALTGGRFSLDLPAGSRFSLIAFADLAGLTLTGARWPLNSASLAAGSTRTLSNVALGGPVAVDLTSGKAILVAYPDGD